MGSLGQIFEGVLTEEIDLQQIKKDSSALGRENCPHQIKGLGIFDSYHIFKAGGQNFIIVTVDRSCSRRPNIVNRIVKPRGEHIGPFGQW